MVKYDIVNIQVKPISEPHLDEFYTVFSQLVRTEFPEYTTATREAMLNNPKGWTKESFRRNLKNSDYIVLAAWDDNTIVGVLDAWMQFGGVCFLSWLMVHPAFQKKGVGKKLVATLERLVEKAGYHQVYLYADHRNIPFYETKLGYTNSGLMKKSWFNTDNYIFTKNIQEPNENVYIK